MKIVKKVNGNLGELILSSKGFESSSGTKILSRALKRCQAIKKNNKIMLFSYPDYNTEKQYIDACLKIGFRKENIYVYEKDTSPSLIVEMDYIYITAGNTFEILDWLKGRSENFNAIKQAVLKGTNYIGVSAGAMIAGTDIELAYEFDKNFVTLKDLSGLGLYEGTIIPHYGKREFNRLKRSLGKKIDMYKNMFSISDKDCIVMEAERPFK